ncbi:MAG: hypothetical protein ACXAC7_22590, partial [Candidatus Hodarchaeales archaeon]
MIIQDLWVISLNGSCFFRFQTQFSEYSDIDDCLFGGFISALMVFLKPRTINQKPNQVDFIKLQKKEIYFIKMDQIIVVCITHVTNNANIGILNNFLQIIGEKFLRHYSNELNNSSFNWHSISFEFSKEISTILSYWGICPKKDLKTKLINA